MNPESTRALLIATGLACLGFILSAIQSPTKPTTTKIEAIKVIETESPSETQVEIKTNNATSKTSKTLNKEATSINKVASPSQLQADRESACNAQLKEMTINANVCAQSARTFTTDLEMSDWMSSIKITYPLRFDKSGNRLPEDDAYLDRVKAFYKAHGQDINDESTFHPSKIIPSPIAHSVKSP